MPEAFALAYEQTHDPAYLPNLRQAVEDWAREPGSPGWSGGSTGRSWIRRSTSLGGHVGRDHEREPDHDRRAGGRRW